MNTTTWKKRPTIVDKRTKSIQEEISYKDILKDLYISFLEDEDDRRDYWVQVEEFEEWYESLEPGLDHFLVERLVLQGDYAQKTEKEAEEIRDKYFKGITRESLKIFF